MDLKFVCIELPTDDAEYMDVRFKVKGDLSGPPFFIGQLQASIARDKALSQPLSATIAQARQLVIDAISK